MAHYLIYFNQQWVGDHTPEWFASRGPLANAVVDDLKAAGAYLYAAGVVEDDDDAFFADARGGSVTFGAGGFAPHEQRLGGFTLIDVPTEAEAREWAGRLAEACGWPQEVRRVY